MRHTVKRFLKAILYFHGIVFMTVVLTHCSFVHYSKKSYLEAEKQKPYDVIIVPGSPYLYGSVSNIMKMRVFWAKHLYDSGYTKNIIFSGSSVYSPYVEGIVMKIMADSLGIPSDHTFAETRAEHSTENVYYSMKLARSLGFTKIAVATDPYQAGMLKSFTEKYCDDVQFLPVIFGVMDFKSKRLPNIDSTSAYVPDFVSLNKRETFWERMRGTRGKRIIQEIAADQILESAKIPKTRKGAAVGN